MKNRPASVVPARSAALPAQVLAARQALFADGYAPGAPVHVPPRALAIDRACCRSMRCPRCNRRGLAHEPYRKGLTYRALAVCRCCGFCEEV
jgi:hypothetical protein